MLDSAALWADRLFDRLDDDLAAAVRDRMPIDAIAMGSAHVAHGIQLAIHAGDLPVAGAAAYLRMLAEALDESWDYMPLLVTVPMPKAGEGR
ncbi:MAG: hypothetical protein VR70_08120 [Rhodospirillaceae bacterium BRH_c57]|nr:MAG: hypothetical protein VR70_08120 [Rhodospirillaceae bacterium BRH_c57]